MRHIDEQFKRELSAILNIHGIDNDCYTADHILADYVCGCLEAFGETMETRIVRGTRTVDAKDDNPQTDIPFGEEEEVGI